MQRKWLENIRLSEKKSQSDIASMCGITQQHYSLIELGNRRPSIEAAKAMSTVLNFEKYGFDWTNFFEDESKEE